MRSRAIGLVPSASSFAERRLTSTKMIQLVVSSNAFVLCWIGVQLLHLASLVFLFFVGAVHLLISTPAVYRAVWLLRIERATLNLAGWTYLALAVFHVIEIARDVRQSIRFGRLTFAANKRAEFKSEIVTVIEKQDPSVASSPSKFQRLCLLKSSVVANLNRFQQSIGVTGKHFQLLMNFRQAVEITSQIYQTYLFSRSVPHLAVVRALLVLLLINCTYMPLVRAIFKNRPGPRLAAILAVDLVLDTACSTIVPMVIVVPRFLEFNWTTHSYPDTLRFNVQWFVRTLSEVRQVLSASTFDHLTTIVPYVAVIDSLGTLKAVLMRVAVKPKRRNSNNAIAPVQDPLTPTKAQVKQPDSASANQSEPKRKLIFFTLFDKITWLVAVGILTVHLHAEFRPANKPSASCKLLMKPWFAQSMSCAVFDYNCYREGLSGSEDHLASELNRMDQSTVMKLVFSHCSSLSMPPVVTKFSRLLGIQTLNCTITDWPSSASITQTSHSKMAEVQLFATNMSVLPDGLLHGDLPTRLSLVIHLSNLTHLPEDAGDKWSGHLWPYFSIQRTPLQKLPASFSKARAFYLTLLDTHVSSIDDDLLSDFELITLRLSNNQFLTRLPANIGSDVALRQLEAGFTNVSSLPPWLEEWLRTKEPALAALYKEVVFTLHGTPFCDTVDAVSKVKLCSPRNTMQIEDSRYETVKSLHPL